MQAYQYFAVGSTVLSVIASVCVSVFIAARYLGKHEERFKALGDSHSECKEDRKKIRQEMHDRLYDEDGKARFVYKDDLDEMLALRHEPIMREVTATKEEVGGLRKELSDFVKTLTGTLERMARLEGAREAEKHHE